jgi:signal transduction histidine kinase/DNA-binding response OmpR family regulator
MAKNGMKYLVLWLFLVGIALIVFIQFFSGQNITRSIQGNKRLLQEVALQNDLRQLESDVLTVESDIRGVIITNDALHLTGVNQKIVNIEKQINSLDDKLRDSLTITEVALLTNLVREKLTFTDKILNAYKTGGKAAAERVINTNQGKIIRDSIVLVIGNLDSIRRTHLSDITDSIEASASRARLWGFGLAAIACAACIIIFLYIANKGWQQQKLIETLNESERKVKEVANVKEQFLANMSHEIRTPMNAILGFTNLLKKTDLSSQQVQYVEYIHSSSENLLTLINDILDLSKIEAGKLDIDEAPFSLNGLISSVEIMFRDKARQKGLKFHIHVDPAIQDVLCGDAVRLTQILINLLSNAIKFTDKGSVQLSVSPVKQNAELVELEFSVRDTGLGIAPEKRALIFERFHQADAQTTRRFGGTGLGLSIVKQLVDLQNGIIQVRSEVGQGTEFTVRLPFRPAADSEFSDIVAREEVHSSIKGVKVLIAEDNAMNQQLMRHLMKQWNIDFHLVSNGREALEVLRKEAFSLILMDIQMPEMDGYGTTVAVRNELKLDTPIIAMTAHAMAGEKERCISYGMNDYISKPVKEGELFTILRTYAREVAETPAGESFINLAYLRELSFGDPEFENAIIRQFIVQVPDELKLLREAIESRDYAQIKSLAHGMKSSVAYLGLSERLFPTLQRMEKEAVDNKPDAHFEEDFVEVQNVCDQAVKEARQLIQVSAS